MALQKQSLVDTLEKDFIGGFNFQIFMPSTVNYMPRKNQKIVISTDDNKELTALRQNMVDAVIADLSRVFSGCTVDPDHFGAWFDSTTKRIVTERGTRISVFVPIDVDKVEYTDKNTGKIRVVSVSEFFILLAREIRDTFNQDSVLISAAPLYFQFVS